MRRRSKAKKKRHICLELPLTKDEKHFHFISLFFDDLKHVHYLPEILQETLNWTCTYCTSYLEMWLGSNYVSKALIAERKLYGIFYHAWTNLSDWKHKPSHILYYINAKKSRETFSLGMWNVKTTSGLYGGRSRLLRENGHWNTTSTL